MLGRAWPMLAWLKQYDRAELRGDVAAGITTAVVLVPQSMAYAMIAGLPPIVGLYAALAAQLVYPLFGTSRQLSVGPVAMDSLLTATAVAAVAAVGSHEAGQAAVLLALMVGIIQVLLGLARAGYIANFLSRPVISGFTSAAAVIIATTQLGEALGVTLPRTSDVFHAWWQALSHASDIHPLSLVLTIVSFAILKLLPKQTTKVPASLVVVVLATGLDAVFDLQSHGVRVVGAVPSGLPALAMPAYDMALLTKLLPAALTLSLVSYMESLTTATAFARKHRYELSPSRELVAVGLANAVSGFVGGYPVAGGLSRSAVNERAGARTPLASILSGAMVALTLLLFTPVFRGLPKAALAAVVLGAVVTLIDLATPKRLFEIKRNDFWLLCLTFAATLWLGISQGIAVGVLASLLLLIVRTTRPHFAVLGHVPGTQAYLNVTRHPNVHTWPGVLIVRVDAQLYFGNVSSLRQTLRTLESEAKGELRAVVLDASGMNQLDSSALEALEDLDRDYAARGIRLLYARVKGPVRDVMQRAGMLDKLRAEQRIFTRTHDASECAHNYVEGRKGPCEVACGDLSHGVDPGC